MVKTKIPQKPADVTLPTDFMKLKFHQDYWQQDRMQSEVPWICLDLTWLTLRGVQWILEVSRQLTLNEDQTLLGGE